MASQPASQPASPAASQAADVKAAASQETGETGVLLSDPNALAGALIRLHAHNDGVLFWNEQRTFKLMLRNDPIDADTLACELAMLADEDDTHMANLLDLTNDGYVDEPGTYVLDEWSFDMAEFGPQCVEPIMHAINRAYLYRVCPCGRYLVKDDADMCVFCHMTSTPSRKRTHFCSICCEDGLEMHMTQQPCCKQHLHAKCLSTWHAKSSCENCPLCRQ